MQIIEDNEIMVEISYDLDTNLITNGDFEDGNDGSFTSDYTFFDLELFAGTYKIGNNPTQGKPEWEDCSNRDGTRSNMLLANASGNVNDAVWCQTVQVEQNTDYIFNAEFVSARYKIAIPFIDNLVLPELQAQINGQAISNSIKPDRARCAWTDFADIVWNSGSATTAEICIYNTVATDDDNDFALDNISFRPICDRSRTAQIVFSEQNPTFVPISREYCLVDQTYLLVDWLSGNEDNGEWSIDGATATVFNPVDVGIGKHYIQYTLEDALCTVSHLDSVVVREQADASFLIQAAICSNAEPILFDTIPVISQGGIWNVNGTVSDRFDPALAVPGPNVVTYRVGQEGCRDTSVQNIITSPAPGFDLPPDATLTCADPVFALEQPQGFSYQYTQLFSDGSTQRESGEFPLFLDTASTFEIILIDDANGCRASDDILILDSRSRPVPAFQLREIPCLNLDTLVITEVMNAALPVTYSLDSLNFQSENIFADLAPDEYNVFITDANGCSSKTSLIILPRENLDVDLLTALPPPATINIGDSVLLMANVSGDPDLLAEIVWSPEEFSCTDCLENFVFPLAPTLFIVEVFDRSGCPSRDSLFVDVLSDHSFFVPNAITPNGDGINDALTIAGPTLLSISQVSIWDRWGNLIFKKNNLQPGEALWNGQAANATMLTGTFVYSIELNRTDGVSQLLAGSVSIVR